MYRQYDNLTKSQSEGVSLRVAFWKAGLRFAGILLASLILSGALTAWAGDSKLGPLIQVSKDPDSLAGCDTGDRPGGNMNFTDQFENRVTVDPSNLKHIVATWAGHDSQAGFVGVTFDGGATWQETALPGITTCTGGQFTSAIDNYLRTIAPNGDIYLASVGTSGHGSAILVNKSTDGGLTWTTPITIDQVSQYKLFLDKPTTTADPADPLIAYVIYERLDNSSGIDITYFTRTTDGGRTWEAPRAIADPGPKNANTGHKILVQPNGTLVAVFSNEVFDSAHGGVYSTSVATIRSTDRGQTWLGPVLGPEIKSINPLNPAIGATDPDTGMVLNEFTAAINFAAVDPHSGALYVVWEDSRFSNGQYNGIAFSQSTDSGLTWSKPIPINRTPNNIPAADRQAFRPTVAVAADGTIGVTYYDFRFNDASPGTRTDYWFVSLRPATGGAATVQSNWKNELRLTNSSFDLQAAPIFFGGEFVGDSNGLDTAGNDFVATWSMPSGTDQGNIYFRRISP